MDDCYQIFQRDLNDFLEKKLVTVKVDFYDNCYNKNLRPLYLANICDEYMDFPDESLEEAVDFIRRNTDVYYEDIFSSIYDAKLIKTKIM